MYVCLQRLFYIASKLGDLSCMESSTLLQIILMACLYVVCQNCNKYVYTIFRTPCWCPMEVHQHGGSILGSVNLCKTFLQIFEVWENLQT